MANRRIGRNRRLVQSRKYGHRERGPLERMIDQIERNVLNSCISDATPGDENKMLGIAPVAADQSIVSGCRFTNTCHQ